MHYGLDLYDDEYLEHRNYKKFDYKTTKLPDRLHFYFGDQLERARKILNNRSDAEIDYGFESLDWMLRKGSELFFDHSWELLNNGKEEVFVNRVKVLRLLKEKFDLSEQDSFKNATWAEYFALLSLANVLDLFYSMQRTFTEPKTDFEKEIERSYRVNIERNIIDGGLEAMDAISHAEGLIENNKIINDQHDSAKERGRKGGLIRVSKFDNIKNKVIQLYLDEKLHEISNRKAAFYICDKLSADIENSLTGDEPEITVAKWIGQYKKGTLDIRT